MILVRNSVDFFEKFIKTYNYVYFITLKNAIIFVRSSLIKITGFASGKDARVDRVLDRLI
jgi:hypothetical protein